MKLIILGSGTSIPLPDRSSPSIGLIKDSEVVLFDMGPGTLRQLAISGSSHENIKHIFLTHFHPDHTADIIHFLFASMNPSILKSRNPFTITAPNGFSEHLKKLKSAYEHWLDLPPEMIEIEELDIIQSDIRSYNGFDLSYRHVEHTSKSISYRIDLKNGKSIVYSGDTGFCKGIIELSLDVDILILECSFPDGKEQEGHLTPSQAGSIASLCRAKKLILTHFYPEVLGTDIESDCRKTYGGKLILAEDLMSFNV